MQFECGTRILRVIHGRDARATLSELSGMPSIPLNSEENKIVACEL